MEVCSLQILCRDMFVTDSLWRYACYILCGIMFVIKFSVEICLLQIPCGGMFVRDFLWRYV